MNRRVLLPILALPVALAMTVSRYLVPLLLEVRADIPDPETLTLLTVSGRFSTFVLVYGLLFGLAYWVGGAHATAHSDRMLALATGASGALSCLVGTGVVILVTGTGGTGAVVSAAVALGSTLGAGVQLAVVAFAGLSLAGRRRSPVVRASETGD